MERLPLTHIGEGLPCFICRHGQGGLGTQFWLVGDHVEGDWLPDASFEGWPGVMHGGATAALLDEAGGWAMIAVAGRVGFTTRLDIRFHKPVPSGQPARVQGKPVRIEARGGVFESEVRLADGSLAASATVEYAFVDEKAVERILGRGLEGRLGEWIRAAPEARRELTLRWSRELAAKERR